MKHLSKRILACLLAGALTVSSFAVAAPMASAAGATLDYWPEPLPVGYTSIYYYQNESLQPYGPASRSTN